MIDDRKLREQQERREIQREGEQMAVAGLLLLLPPLLLAVAFALVR